VSHTHIQKKSRDMGSKEAAKTEICRGERRISRVTALHGPPRVASDCALFVKQFYLLEFLLDDGTYNGMML